MKSFKNYVFLIEKRRRKKRRKNKRKHIYYSPYGFWGGYPVGGYGDVSGEGGGEG